jgi:signal transduction histidine kinase
MTDPLKILILEDSPYDAEEIMRRLELSAKFDCCFRLATDKATYLQALDEFFPSLILSDHSLPQFDSKEALTIARERFPDIPFIMVTGTLSEELAIDMIKAGVDDYILKDRMTRLPAAIIASVQKRKLESEKKRLEKEREFEIARAILKAQEQERNYLGRELHDNVNQLLAAAKMILSVAKYNVEKIPELLAACQDNIENAIQENRKIAQGLVVHDFETVSFQEQLINLGDNMLQRSGIQVILDTSGLQEEGLENQQKLVVYRIVQEQFTNIVKHADAGLVYVSLFTTPRECKMIIFDNGKGMEAGTKTEGIGLRNIRGRLAIFNGTLDIRTSPGRGFTMDIAIPILPFRDCYSRTI